MKQVAHTVLERFLRYVQIDTQSDPNSVSFPSTAKQKHLGEVLVAELTAMGIEHVEMNEFGYVLAVLPSNLLEEVPVICFCAHMDTAPDCSGTNVKPQVIKHYQGEDIILPGDEQQVISTNDYPYLLTKIGCDIVTADGTTLLGADDKSGVAIIMDLAFHLMQQPHLPHGEIRLLFTPDEEVGRGTEKLDMQWLNAHFGYTLDGGEAGTLEDETFSADAATITFNGIIAHPGYAKGKMVNAIKLAANFVERLPADTLAPEATSGRDGFVHPVQVSGTAEQTTVQLIIRDFETAQLAPKAELLRKLAAETVAQFPGTSFTMAVQEQYRNMKEVLDKYPQVVTLAEEAFRAAGINEIVKVPIRGGTDGSRLSFMGLPTANLFTGMQAIHSKKEHVCVQDMELAVKCLLKLTELWSKAKVER